MIQTRHHPSKPARILDVHMPPFPKKAKHVCAQDLVDLSWSHYLRFLDSIQDDNPEGDIDELLEVSATLEPHLIKPERQAIPESLKSREEMLPVMMSVVSTGLADAAITSSLRAASMGQGTGEISEIQKHITNALEYCPWNAATWSMAANWARITKRLTTVQIGSWYHHASLLASQVRTLAIQISEDESVDNSVKEWIEFLLLNQIAGVELEGEEDGNDENDFWSPSSVEGTARFMSGILLSTTGQHEDARKQLQYFDLTHRLHPHFWMKSDASRDKSALANHETPALFCDSDSTILSTGKHSRLCQVFGPESSYWKESDYDNRGYYSFFVDRPSRGTAPKNLIEDVIISNMLPAVEQHVGKDIADTICGFEWWIHTRPIEANLGHNLHFDTDEALLSQEGKVTHPIISSVLYLTGGKSGGGPTIVLKQDPDARKIAEYGWRVEPKDNQLLLFPGRFLHGVLPCHGLEYQNSKICTDGKCPCLADLWEDTTDPGDSKSGNRLTFMVGFWTRNVPDQMNSRVLYGPCGPLPPESDEHSWVQSITQGYTLSDTTSPKSRHLQLERAPVAKVEPAWEVIQPRKLANDTDFHLVIPKGVDHRFFVKDAPFCFRASLFEKDEFDDDDPSVEVETNY